MAGYDEVLQSLLGFAARFNENKVVKKMVKGWERQMVVNVTDLGAVFKVVCEGGILRGATEEDGGKGLISIAITASSDVVAGIFSGKLNPAREYARGNLKFNGSAKDEMKVDAIIQMIWG